MRVLTARALGVRRRVGVVAAILTALAVLGTSVPPTEAAGFGARPYGVSQEPSAHVEVTASPMWLEVGMSARLTATVIDEEGEPVHNARVLFTESLSVAAVDTRLKTTDENGQAHSAFSAERGGVFTIIAAVVEILPDSTWGPTLFQDEIDLHVAEPEPEPEPEFVPEFEPEFEPEAELEPAAILPAIPALRAGGAVHRVAGRAGVRRRRIPERRDRLALRSGEGGVDVVHSGPEPDQLRTPLGRGAVDRIGDRTEDPASRRPRVDTAFTASVRDRSQLR